MKQIVYVVKFPQTCSDGQRRWRRIGTATRHLDGNISVALFALPVVNEGNELVLKLLPTAPDELREEADE